MILGILSDTHGRHERCAAALRALRALGADAFVHCGDIGDELVLDRLAGLRVWFVWGNTDAPLASLARYAANIGLTPPATTPVWIELDGRRFAVLHGHERAFADAYHAALHGGADEVARRIGVCDAILHGHTHVAGDTSIGGVRFINPGALHRAPVHTVCTLDTRSLETAFWRIDDRESATPERWSPPED
ncbi:MAG: metallophosphoesterase [Phycisphaerae bacterium]